MFLVEIFGWLWEGKEVVLEVFGVFCKVCYFVKYVKVVLVFILIIGFDVIVFVVVVVCG